MASVTPVLLGDSIAVMLLLCVESADSDFEPVRKVNRKAKVLLNSESDSQHRRHGKKRKSDDEDDDDDDDDEFSAG